MRRRSLLMPALWPALWPVLCPVLCPALCAAAVAAAGPVAAAVRLAVPVSHAARLQIPGAAGSVVVGDPAVADAVVIDAHTIYVQGKAYGQTEIVVLDRAGRQVWQGDIAVITPHEGRVTVMRGPVGAGGGTGAVNSLVGGVVLMTEMTCADVCTAVVPAPKSKDK